MNRNIIVGLVLVVVAVVLACVFAARGGGAAERCVGMAIWYLPYVAFVAGVERILCARR